MNCDPWWTSPLIQVGGPIVAVGSILLIGLGIAITPPKPDPAATTHSPFPTGSPFSAPPQMRNTVATGPLSPPQLQTAPALAPIPKLPASFFVAPPDPDVAMFANFEQLRYQVRVASHQMRLRNAIGARSERPSYYPFPTPARSIHTEPLMHPSL